MGIDVSLALHCVIECNRHSSGSLEQLIDWECMEMELFRLTINDTNLNKAHLSTPKA